jgi:hypothetical protein
VRCRRALPYGVPMLRGMHSLGWSAVVAMASVLLLAGCTGEGEGVPSVSRSGMGESTKPSARFASQSEAAGAARKLYEEYLAASRRVSEQGGRGVSQLKPLVTPGDYSDELAGAKALATRHVVAKGPTKLIRFRLQRADLESGALTAYACVDLSKVRVLDARGTDVTPPGRPDRQTSLVKFDWFESHLAIARNGTWSGQSIC